MAQEMGILAISDDVRSRDSSSLGLLLLRWLLIIPRCLVLALLASSFATTGVLAYITVILAARLPQEKWDWRKYFLGWTWRIGFYNLEEFAYRNWTRINWGSELELNRSSKHSGRHFPAGPWTIDFLARDKNTNDIVVIHLKRGATSDSAVGQLLRHMSWVKENVASAGQNVRGMMLARETDAALEYAVKDLPQVEVKTYSLGFQLALKPLKSTRPFKATLPVEQSEPDTDDNSKGAHAKTQSAKAASTANGQTKAKTLVS